MKTLENYLVKVSFICLFIFVGFGCFSSGSHAVAGTQPVTQPSYDVVGTLDTVHSITASPEAQSVVSLLGPWGTLGLLGINTILSLITAGYARKNHKVLSDSDKNVDSTVK